jgi:ABC-type hemin transport system substrate-binding protein
MSEEKTARSTVVKALAEAEQALKDFDADKAKLSQALKITKAAYTVTRDNLASKSQELDDVVIREQEANTLQEQAEAKLADAEKRLATTKGEKKNQGLLLETAQASVVQARRFLHHDDFDSSGQCYGTTEESLARS